MNNFAAVEELISSNQNIDVLTLSETHISASQSNEKLYTISGYNFEKRDRTVGKGVGVAVYIKDSVSYVRRTDVESEKIENIVIEILLTASKNMMNRCDKVLRRARKTNYVDDWSAYKILRDCNNAQRKAKANYHKNKIQEGRQNPKQFWKAVKDVFPTKPGSHNKSSSVTHSKNLADSFRDYYLTAR